MARRRARSIGLANVGISPLTGGYRIPRPGSRTGFDSSGERRAAARDVRGWSVSSAKIPRSANPFQKVVTSTDARRKGTVAGYAALADPEAT